MKIAMTVWGERISAVLDCARTLLVAEIVREEVVARRHEIFDARCLDQIVQILARQEVSVLICGAISQEPANIIEAGGIKLGKYQLSPERRKFCFEATDRDQSKDP